MSRRSNRFGYTAVRSEGGMLPYELLEQIGAHASELGIAPTAYFLAEHEVLGEAQSRAWLRLVGLWKSFCKVRESWAADDPRVRETRERWLLPLFQELGYGRLASAKSETSLFVDEREFPISHMHGCVPIHLLGVGVSLDRRTPKVRGAIHSSPHGLLQDFLNRSEPHLWGIVSNGLLLRVLRDSHTFTRRPYLEFDLEAIFNGELYSDFRLLWLCAHASRLSAAEATPDKPDSAAIEIWYQRAKSEGVRVRDRLRDGVQKAIELLGSGFMRHPANLALDQALERGELTQLDYYRELLRLIYRLIFVFVAEDRGVLQPPIEDELPLDQSRARHDAQRRYLDYYATTKLRELALRRRGGPHGDRWVALRLVLTLLHRGCPQLDLPALGSALFRPETTPHLHDAQLANIDLLGALRALCTFTDEAGIMRPVSWRHVGADELGSVFESLLELVPKINRSAGTFKLEFAPGNERKTTGSYYTPESLVECLLDSALDPVLDRACGEKRVEQALLDLKVCDPACGSGHFLVAAGRRIAHRLAQARAGEDEPSPQEIRRALRDVYGRCLFGVDINPLAVELCKVSLWVEAIDPQRALPFLDGHILCGNSLLGATPASLVCGIPDDAFKPIEGDDPEVASRLRKRNREERTGKAQGVQRGLFVVADGVSAVSDHDRHRRRVQEIEAMSDGSFDEVVAKENRYAAHRASPEARALEMVANTWCAAFVWPKDEAHEDDAPTHWLFERIRENPARTPKGMRAVADGVAREYQLFHWHLGFPQVFSIPTEGAEQGTCGWNGGFDVVLGNPPWERIKLQEKEFFATRSVEIAGAKNAAARKKLIEKLPETQPELWQEWQRALRIASGESLLVRTGARYPLCGKGDINTYAVFAELDCHVVHPDGIVGYIGPAGIAMDDTTKDFFGDVIARGSLESLFHFENEEFIFPAIHHSIRFCLMTIGGVGRSCQNPTFVSFARKIGDLREPQRRYTLVPDDFSRINPNTRTLPTFRTRQDATINTSVYSRIPVLQSESRNPWAVRLTGMFHMSNDSGLFLSEQAGGVSKMMDIAPLYEAKMIHHYDHRYGTYKGQSEAQANQGILPRLTPEEHAKADFFPQPRYWVRKSEVDARLEGVWSRSWILGWRRSARSGDVRSIIAAVIPCVGIGDSYFLMPIGEEIGKAAGLVASMQTFVLDYCARQKLGGTNCSFYIIRQLPVLPPSAYDAPTPWDSTTTLADWILPRVLELTYTAWDVIGFARDHGYEGPPYRWDEERRFWLRAELDAAYFHLYGLAPDEVDHVMESFWLVRQRDEKAHGTYRTKVAILDLYQRMATAIAAAPYRTVLDPPPAHLSIAHPPLTEAQAKELAPILERALSAPPLTNTNEGEATAAPAVKPKPKSKSPAKAAKPSSPADPTPVEDMPLFRNASVASHDTSLAAAAAEPTATYAARPDVHSQNPLPGDPESIRHLLALEDPAITPDMIAVLRVLRHVNAPQSKAELMAATSLDEKRWNPTLNALLDLGLVAKTGRGRGTKYLAIQ